MLSRRTFLHTAAAASAAPVVWSRAAAAPGATASDKINLGFIGVGKMGRGHLGGFLGNSGVRVVAVADVVKERLDTAKQTADKKYAEHTKSGDAGKGIAAYADFRKLLDHPGLDAVVIATPDHWHAIPAVLAARAKKHIYCEKPLTQNLADGRWVVTEVAKAGIVFQTGSQQRSEFSGHFRKAVESVWNGRIGQLKTIRIGVAGPAKTCDLATQPVPEGTDWDFWLGPAPERGYHEILCPKGNHDHFPAWRQYTDYATGGMGDMGAHHFDIAQWAMKMDGSGPVEVIPPADPKKGKGLRFVYASGVVMIHDEFEKGKDGKDIRSDCVFEGTEGTILVSRGGISSLPGTILTEPLAEKAERVAPSNNHKQNWLDGITSGKPTICPAEVGHRSASLAHLGNIGYRLGRKLTWDPVKEKFTDDATADKELVREPRDKWKI
ncbi:MAG: Gfo/Idh/MocA family protein [Fimbriiglobus sp.]